MAIQILPGDQRYAQIGAGFGSLLGGLGSALGAGAGLYQNKQKALSVDDFRKIGANDEEAEFLEKASKKDPAIVRQWIQNKQKQSMQAPPVSDQDLAFVGIKSPEDIKAFRAMPLNQQQAAFKTAFNRHTNRGAWEKFGERALNWLGPAGSTEDTSPYSTSQQQNSILPQWVGDLPRQLGATAMSGYGGFAGTPGNILESIRGIAEPISEKVIGLLPESLQSGARSIRDSGPLNISLPTTQQFKETAQQVLPEGALTPRSGPEQFVQDVAEDIGALMFPLPGTQKAGIIKKLIHSSGISGAGNLAAVATKLVGGGEGAQSAVKLGTMLLTGMGLDKGLRARASEEYAKAADIGEYKRINTQPIRNAALRAENAIKNIGESSPSYKAVKSAVEDLKTLAPYVEPTQGLAELSEKAGLNKIALNKIQEFKAGLSERIKNLTDKKSTGVSALKKLSKDMGDILGDPQIVGKEYAQTIKTADKMWSGIKEAERINKFALKQLKRSSRFSPLAIFLNPTRLATVAATGLAGAGALQAGLALKQLATNAPLRNAYTQMLSAAAKNQAAGVIKYGNKMLKAMLKSQ